MEACNLIQGSQEWKNLRKGRITASKLPIIMGLSPYQTPFQLFEEELGLREPQTSSPHMYEGLRSEGAARQYFFEKMGVLVEPAVYISDENPLFMASLDGISADESLILEIKKNNQTYHEMARSGKIVDFHNLQVQIQMFCADVQNAHYLSYRPGDEVIVVIHRDDALIATAIEEGVKFKAMLDNLEQPELTDQDYVDMTDSFELLELGQLYKYHKSMTEHHKQKSDSLREDIRKIACDRSIKANGFKMSKYPVKGRIDYEGLFDFHGIALCDQDKFRKPSTTNYRITME